MKLKNSKKKNNTNADIEEMDDIHKLIESLQDKFGEGAIMQLGDNKISKVDIIKTGSFSLDLALGVGGVP